MYNPKPRFMHELLDDHLFGSPLETKKEFLDNGQLIEYITNGKPIGIGTKVFVADGIPENGLYIPQHRQHKYLVEDGSIKKIFPIIPFPQPNGQILEIDGHPDFGIQRGCLAWINGKPAPDGHYRQDWLSRIHIKDGKVA